MVVVAVGVAQPRRGRQERRAAGAPAGVTNAETIGRVLYTDYVYFFQAAGLVLLVAMIGAIVLTLRHQPGVRRQMHRRPGRPHAGHRHARGADQDAARGSRQ